MTVSLTLRSPQQDDQFWASLRYALRNYLRPTEHYHHKSLVILDSRVNAPTVYKWYEKTQRPPICIYPRLPKDKGVRIKCLSSL